MKHKNFGPCGLPSYEDIYQASLKATKAGSPITLTIDSVTKTTAKSLFAAIAEAGIPAPKPAEYELPSSSNLDPWLTRALHMSMLQAYDWPNMSGEAILVLIKAAGEKLENKEISEHNAQVILDVLYEKLRETQDRG